MTTFEEKGIKTNHLNLKARSHEAMLLKINNRKAKKCLNIDNFFGKCDLNIYKINKRREYDRHQIKERLKRKLEERNEERIKNMFSSAED